MKTDREKLIEFVNEAHEYCNTINCIGGEECGYDGQLYCFEHLLIDYLISKGVRIPTRCEECIYWDDNGRCNSPTNGMVRDYTLFDDFCSYGERKEDGN
jgi:hypothetical protein